MREYLCSLIQWLNWNGQIPWKTQTHKLPEEEREESDNLHSSSVSIKNNWTLG